MALSTSAKNRYKLTAIIVLAVFCGLVAYYKDMPAGTPLEKFWNSTKYKLGLDLQGGTHLVYQADTSKIEARDQASAVEGVRDVIERRVNAFGVSEPVVQTNNVGGEYRVIVELAGVKDVKQAIDMIGKTPLLEFKEQNPNYNPDLTPAEQKQIDDYNKDAEKRAQDILRKVLVPGANFENYAKQYSEDAGSKDSGGDLGFAKRGQFVTEFNNELFDVLKDGQIGRTLVKTSFGYHIIKRIESRGEGENLEVHSEHILIKTENAEAVKQAKDAWVNTQLSGRHLKRAELQFDQQTGEPQVALEFNDEGKALFAAITERNVGKPVAIFLDGTAISVPTVNEPITEGKAVITGRFDVKEAKQLVNNLSAGALPVPITLMSQETVGASLGQESLDKSLFAGLIGILAVALFMIIFYRLPGIFSVLALIVYTLINLAIYQIFGITLSLAGIAGFILSVGMAVDANVLIFERMKEEIRAGRELTSATEEGFKRAWTSIRDSNVSSLITCAVLYFIGTSVVKGFALTLAIGVLTSMFSAITVTRTFLKTIINIKRVRESHRLFGVKK
ncbi:MAG: protein translocase subunit SecD [Patescibacteria group bacterium]|nr:protein translocase subunit SecD [Patescibacteria group bacterium]